MTLGRTHVTVPRKLNLMCLTARSPFLMQACQTTDDGAQGHTEEMLKLKVVQQNIVSNIKLLL